MSHQSSQIFQKYVSSVVGIDVQNVVRGLPENHVQVDASRSIGFTRDIHAPKPHGATLVSQGVDAPPELVERFARRWPKHSRKAIVKMAREEHFLQRKALHYNGGESIAPEDQSKNMSRATPVSSRMFQQMLKYNKQQASVLNTLWSDEPATIEESCRPLMELSDPEEFREWYPTLAAAPEVKQNCPYCGEDFQKNYNKREVSSHVLACHCYEHGRSFCFDCAEFYSANQDENGPSSHGCPTDDINDMFWGMVYWRSLLIRPGRCPFCPAHRRFHIVREHKRHIEAHIKKLKDRFDCPAQACGHICRSKDELRQHLITAHGMDHLGVFRVH